MKKIIIEGMSCEHCEAHVREALEGLGAKVSEVTAQGGYALCETDKPDSELKAAVEDEGYDVKGIEAV